jgi:hypothetical protein
MAPAFEERASVLDEIPNAKARSDCGVDIMILYLVDSMVWYIIIVE